MKNSKVTNERWKVGRDLSIVSEVAPTNSRYSDTYLRWEVECYGGYLVCDSVKSAEHVRLIAAAPKLLEALQNLENDDNSIPKHAWDMVQDAINSAIGDGSTLLVD